MYNTTTVGTCSECGGRVSVPSVWMSIIPPVPTCEGCGAVAAEHGPVIQMKPAPRYTTKTVTTGTLTVGPAERTTPFGEESSNGDKILLNE